MNDENKALIHPCNDIHYSNNHFPLSSEAGVDPWLSLRCGGERHYFGNDHLTQSYLQ